MALSIFYKLDRSPRRILRRAELRQIILQRQRQRTGGIGSCKRYSVTDMWGWDLHASDWNYLCNYCTRPQSVSAESCSVLVFHIDCLPTALQPL